MKLELNKFILNKSTYNEIDLFREMNRYLSRKYKSIFINETHQHYVEFMSPSTKCKIKRKEISDLWIITYSPKRRKAKMTFLQAKLLKNKQPVSSPFRFLGDYYQYDLLANRPKIKDLSSFNFPSTILKEALSDAIGSYGIFYNDTKNRLEFSFSVASDLLKNKKKANCETKMRTFYFEEKQYLTISADINNDIELRNTINADCFEFCLLNLFVGSPIEENNKTLLIFLKNFFKDLSNAKDFLSFLDLFDIMDNDNNKVKYEGNPNIFLLNIDGKK